MLRTHYDNLKVARDAPVEVIHAAFKALAAKHHPDVNPGNVKAADIFRIINRSYEVLSNPVKRAEHDRWIASQGIVASRECGHIEKPEILEMSRNEKSPIRKWMVGALIVGGVVASGFIYELASPHPAQAPIPTIPAFTANQVEVARPTARAVQPAPYVRPPLAPDGKPWGAISRYAGQDKSTPGEREATIDNTRNSSDMLLKLFEWGSKKPTAIRILFLRANDTFAMVGLAPGRYDVRFRNLDTGVITKIDPFVLQESVEEIPDEANRVIHRKMRTRDYSVTLYTVIDGNVHSTVIGPEDFD